jgi:glycine/D-amino acid oxidase-like deaminating enzyme
MNPVPTRRALTLGFAAAGLAGCAAAAGSAPVFAPPAAPQPLRLPPIRLSMDRLMRITVCTRPFRAAGPRIEAERVGDKLVVHNYGHGGSGWSLAWGSADLAVKLARESGARSFAVIGAGAMGLTTAIRLREIGAAVTIYAKDFPSETRSARATGTWSPDSRIALAGAVDPGFAARWEAMTRASLAAHQAYVGLAGEPVDWTERYYLNEGGPRLADIGPAREEPNFLHLGDRVRDLNPPSRQLAPEENPFTAPRARRTVLMTFNVAEYAHRLITDFLTAGGRIERATFAAPADFARLTEPVILNCTGFGAKQLFGDVTLTPIRGQIGWLAPETARYGVYYRNMTLLSRPEGVVIQQRGASEAFGFDVADETPDRKELEEALAVLAPLFAKFG